MKAKCKLSTSQRNKLPLLYLLFYVASTIITTHSECRAEPCRIYLRKILPSSGYAGSKVTLIGKWGASQGGKVPVINRGSVNKLRVIKWSDAEITAYIPQDLQPGKYKVGVYCKELSKGTTYSSNFLDFYIVPPGSKAADYRKTPHPKRQALQKISKYKKHGLFKGLSLEGVSEKDAFWYAIALGLGIYFLYSQIRERNNPYALPQTPKTDSKAFQDRRGSLMGEYYSIEAIDENRIAVIVPFTGTVKEPYESFNEEVLPPPSKIEKYIKALFALGATYVSIGTSSLGLVAEFPAEKIKNNKLVTSGAIFNLVSIKKALD
ncbi:MAG: hypothetical protein D6808_03625 [Candidatus Dadabacteria bacterium]|nr:MAG: hypothetical protein D6808_03625 [Candidatus Dadabacteria bacterium]